MIKRRIRDGSINFKQLKYLPTLVGDIYDYDKEEQDYMYFPLDEEDIQELDYELDNFYRDICSFVDDLEYQGKIDEYDANAFYGDNNTLKPELRDGYYEGFQIYIDDEAFDYFESDYLVKVLMEKYKDFLNRLKNKYNLKTWTRRWL